MWKQLLSHSTPNSKHHSREPQACRELLRNGTSLCETRELAQHRDINDVAKGNRRDALIAVVTSSTTKATVEIVEFDLEQIT